MADSPRSRARRIKQLFDIISHNSQDVITYCTPGGICEYVSPSVYHIVGYSSEELLGQTIEPFLHPEDRHVWVEAIQAMEQGTDNERVTLRILHRRGDYRWFEVTLRIQRNARGRAVGVIGIGRDVTDERLAAEQLAALKRKYEWILNAASEGIVGIDPKEHIIFANPAAAKILGRTTEEMIGKPFASVTAVLGQDVHSQSLFACTLVTGQVITASRARFCRSDNTYIPVEYSITPINEGDEIVGAVMTFRDITDKLAQEHALQRSRDNLKQAHQLARSGYWELDVEHDHLMWSDEMFAIWGMDPNTFSGTYEAFLQTVVDEDRQAVDHAVQESLQGQLYEIEFRIRTGRGEVRCISALGQTDMDADGRPIRFFGVAQDITARKEQELALETSRELLERSEKLAAVGQLAVSIAHEIRNPLTALKGFIDLMHRKAKGNNKRYLEIMKGEVGRMELILGELLMLAKPQQVHYSMEDVDLLLQEIVAFMSPQAIIHNVVIETSFREDLPQITCEPNQLKQVFINIVRNGIEAMDGGGTLRVLATRSGDYVRIDFVDEGIGISPEKLQHIGEPFFTTKEQGTGLGMMVSQRIVAEHGGRMSVQSTIGQGTTVTIELPIALHRNMTATDEERI
ncbi:PAS domain S-box protein [Alicyclobacillus sacchari]|uniref:PAS domain S-box protein n=1 Tax=Alicyclobacillus sacchari TaxID=392010 RepID=UPI0024E0C438|nr:PAS domain S-box protein [Alicyclobacillus sacchari]